MAFWSSESLQLDQIETRGLSPYTSTVIGVELPKERAKKKIPLAKDNSGKELAVQLKDGVYQLCEDYLGWTPQHR